MESAELFKTEFSSLLAECRIKNEFEFVNVLLGYKGMGDMMTLTHFYESESLFNELPLLMTNDPNNKNNVRIGLFLYCHFFEMDELYRITGNLVNIANGRRFQPFLYDDLQEDELTPGEKLASIKMVANKCGFEKLMLSIDQLYRNKLRNSFFHSNYSITEGEYANTSNRHEIIIDGIRKHRLKISGELMPLITATIEVANHFFNEIRNAKASYTQNKLVIGVLSTPEPIVILGDTDKGLLGWESSSGSALKITDVAGTAYLTAFNMRVNLPNKIHKDLNKRLHAFLQKDKNKTNDPELNQLEKEILETCDEELIKGLAVAYYNYGNNTKDLADKAVSSFEKKSLLQHSLSRYTKSIVMMDNLYHPHLISC